MTVIDELLFRDPEPCDECTKGLALFVSYDGVRRCRPCVRVFADARHWNLVDPPDLPKHRKKKGDQVKGQVHLL